MGRDPDDTSTDFSRWQGHETSFAWRQLSEVVERFARAWQEDADAPRLDDHLPAEPPDLRQLTLVELIKIDLEYRWQSGLRKTLVDYVAEHPELLGKLPADLIHEEYLVRKRAGESVSWEEYREIYPNQARELTRLFPGQGTNTVTMQPWLTGRPIPGSDVRPGEKFDEFEVLMLLGRGAFASVFLARQVSMQRRVALKITWPRGLEHTLLGKCDHPNVVRIHDQRVLKDRGWRLLYMQYVPGGTLRQVVEKVRATPPQHRTGQLLFEVIDAHLTARGEPVLSEAPLRERFQKSTWPEVVCWLGARIALGLSHAHRLGLLHCDLKPANVLLAADGNPKLADFNVSVDSENRSDESEAVLGGSLAYMSPEQLEAYNSQHARHIATLDGRSDLYSLGVTLLELLLGTRPFPAEKVTGKSPELLERMAAIRRAGLAPGFFDEAGAGWPRGLSQVLARLLAPDPAQRYASGQELARRLEICLQPQVLQILFPRPRQWRGRLRHWAPTALVFLIVVPNLLAGWFHVRFPMHRVAALPTPAGWTWAISTFGWVVLLTGLLLCLRRAWPVIRAVQAPQPEGGLSDSALRSLRSRCLQLGPATASLSLCAWMVFSVGTGLALGLTSPAGSVGQVSQFAASQLLGGLIAVAYPYCGVSWLSVCALYPGLAQSARFTTEDQDEIRQLGQNSWLFLLLAAVMPLAAIALSIMLDQDAAAREQRIDLIGLTIVGIVGFFLSMISFRTLQHDLQVMLGMCGSRPDSHDSQEDGGRWFDAHL